MKSQSQIILMACMIGAVALVMTQLRITMRKEVIENYNEIAFIAEPYLASLANMEVDTDCGKYGVYPLMMTAAHNNSKIIYPCGADTQVDVEAVLKPLHEQFICEFGKNYYLMVYNKTQGIIFNLPGNPYDTCPIKMRSEQVEGATVMVPFVEPCVVMLAQMPIPIPGGNSTRIVLSRANNYKGEVDCG